MSKELVRLTGVVDNIEKDKFHVSTSNGHRIVCYLGGKLRKFNIRICVQDSVEIELSPYDLTIGRIVKRLK